MKQFLPLIVLLLAGFFSCKKDHSGENPTPTNTDSFTVTVNNGYGSGKYKKGDTVHIFSTAYSETQVFDTWTSSDDALLNGKSEWHTWFIMPQKNVTFTGSVKNIAAFTLQFENIRGRDRMKPVYYYFPAGHKGFVYLLHGTSGNAASVVNGFEFQQLIRELVNDNFGVIVTEAEESTTGIDANGDGKIRWATLPYDSVTNVDFANIKIITDTFYNRGVTSRSKLRYSVGMSNGGNFSTYLCTLFNYKAGISYCAPSGNPIASSTNTPIQFCMQRYDNNENVGPTGNASALTNSQTISGRGICSKYFINEHSPLYPERFARRGDITVAKSIAVFNEIKAKGFLDNKNYFIGYSDVYINAYTANPSLFPELNSLSLSQKLFVSEQVDLATSDHHMYSDYNKATLKFLNTQCN